MLQRLLTTGEPNKPRVVAGPDNRPGSVRVGRAHYKYSDALRQNLARGLTPGAMPSAGTSKRNKNARQERQRSLARSPMLLEALRRRLTGDVVGAPRVTNDDVRRLGHLTGLSEALRLDDKAGRTHSAAARERLRKELEGELGFLRSAIARGKQALSGTLGRLFTPFQGLFERLTTDKLQRGLGGLDIGRRAADQPVTAHGYDKVTPGQSQRMVAVQSSNVASVGWEPHQQYAKELQNDLGTLYIQFRNGWMYRYVNCPRWVYNGMLRAASKGKYVWAVLRRGLYPDGVPYGSAQVEGYERIK